MKKRPWKPLLVCWSVLILVATLLPGQQLRNIPGTDFPEGTDLVIHFLLFAGFGFLFTAYIFAEKKRSSLIKSIFQVTLYGILFGALTEFLQAILPIQRDTSWFDFIADITGNTSGIALCIFILHYFKKR